MASQISLKEYLKNSREKRQRLVNLANVFFERVMQEEQRKVRSRGSNYSCENAVSVCKKGVILEPIQERVTKSRTLVNRNRLDSL